MICYIALLLTKEIILQEMMWDNGIVLWTSLVFPVLGLTISKMAF